MRVLILGAGALGSLLGARLSLTDAQVILLSTDKEHITSIQKNGLIVEEMDGSLSRFTVQAVHEPGAVGDGIDLVLVTVKTYDTDAALASISGCRQESTLFLTLQNGIGNWERIASRVGKEPSVVGVTAQGATYLEPGKIRHGGSGKTFIGEFNQPASARVRSLVELFNRAGLESFAADSMQPIIWEKLLINVGINAITALTGIRNGGIAEIDAARKLSLAAVEEAAVIARAKAIEIREDIGPFMLSVARATAANRSSMGQDIDQQQPTEIDSINGAIVGFGEEMGVPTPINWAITQLIKTLEATFSSNPNRNE